MTCREVKISKTMAVGYVEREAQEAGKVDMSGDDLLWRVLRLNEECHSFLIRIEMTFPSSIGLGTKNKHFVVLIT
jgi:hypothetical protein